MINDVLITLLDYGCLIRIAGIWDSALNGETNDFLLKTQYRQKDASYHTNNELKTGLSGILDYVQAGADHDSLLLAHLSHERAGKIVAALLMEMSETLFKQLLRTIQAVVFHLMTDKNNINHIKPIMVYAAISANTINLLNKKPPHN